MSTIWNKLLVLLCSCAFIFMYISLRSLAMLWNLLIFRNKSAFEILWFMPFMNSRKSKQFKTEYHSICELVSDRSSNHWSHIIQDLKVLCKYHTLSNKSVLQCVIFQIFGLTNREIAHFHDGYPLNATKITPNTQIWKVILTPTIRNNFCTHSLFTVTRDHGV